MALSASLGFQSCRPQNEQQADVPNELWSPHMWWLWTQRDYLQGIQIPCKHILLILNAWHSRYFSSCLFKQPLLPSSKDRRRPILFLQLSCLLLFSACNARVVFKTNENGTQEAKWIHLALCSPLPCCYLFLWISLEATFVNMAAEKLQARESCFCIKQIT